MLNDAQADDLGIGLLIRKAFAGEAVILPPIEYSSGLAGDQVGLTFSMEARPWIQCYLYPVKDEHDEVRLIVNTYLDLTGLSQVEGSARELKPALQDVFRAALNRGEADRILRVEATAILEKLAALTPREREVMIHVVAGKPNKAIADDLGITLVTVKAHRGQVMRKLGVSSVADLVRLCERAGVSPTL
jgi:DNA-binding CsgD family transcriptional regulator